MSLSELAVRVACGLVVLGGLVSFAGSPVGRFRVERFARRQRLTVTAGNGDQIIRYLATTRRWRASGLAAGLIFTLATTPTGQLRVDYPTVFAGWFLGALVAEVRIAHLAYGPVRLASLQPRRPEAYLSRFSWALGPASAVVAAVVGAGTLVAAWLDRAEPERLAAVWFVIAVALAIAVRVIQRAVLRRPQPLVAPDVLAADDAIRSRSLHVLAGGGAALVLLCVMAQLSAVNPHGQAAGALVGFSAIGVFGASALGWFAAVVVWPPHQRQSGHQAPLAGAP